MSTEEKNHLLRSLEPEAQERFAAHLQPYELRRGDVLHQQGADVEWVYFPRQGLLGVFSETIEGESLESAKVGCEGAVGVFEACGSRTWFARAVVQVPGEAGRMRASQYRQVYDRSPEWRTAVHKYVEVLLTEARQLVVCNALHSVESRLSRCILDALERSGLTNTLPLTQESLARMIGAQRTTVAVAMSAFQRDGLISSSRGAIKILNPPGLDRLGCSCRQTVRFASREIQSSGEDACEASVTG